MKDTVQNSAAYAKAMLVGLIFECPLGGNPEDCQLYEHRKLPMNQKFGWLNSLSDDELQAYYRVHFDCLVEKEK